MPKRLLTSAAFLVGALLSLGWFYQPAEAALTRIQRENLYMTIFTDPNTFAGAETQNHVLQTWLADAAGDTRNAGFTLGTSTNATCTGDASMAVSNFVFTPPTPTTQATADFTVTATGLVGLVGVTDLYYDGQMLPVSISLGHYALHEYWASNSGVEPGYPYYWQMSIPGDWSGVGTNQGQHVRTYNSAEWTVDQDFVFDGTNTVFRAHVDQYTYGHNVNLDFTLYGAAPLPPTLLMVGSGLLGLLGWRRFQKD